MFKGWLIVLYGLIIIQILIGGTTRLTESGLSITEWNVLMGTFPPMNFEDWNEEFEKYKDSPQYEKMNKGMSLESFKFIFFWEYFHRLWGRLIGLVAFLGLIYMILKKKILKKQKFYGFTICLMILVVGVYGWIMVASGLKERPWVNAYSLSIHLSLAVITLTLILKGIVTEIKNFSESNHFTFMRRLVLVLIIFAALQLFLGGMVAGMKSALFYPTWPDMNESLVPSVLKDVEQWNFINFINYDKNVFMAAFTQFFHRNVAYILFGLIVFSLYKSFQMNVKSKWIFLILFIVTIIQVFLGILILLHSIGSIPILYGVIHQIVGIVIFQILFYILFAYYNKNLVSESI